MRSVRLHFSRRVTCMLRPARSWASSRPNRLGTSTRKPKARAGQTVMSNQELEGRPWPNSGRWLHHQPGVGQLLAGSGFLAHAAAQAGLAQLCPGGGLGQAHYLEHPHQALAACRRRAGIAAAPVPPTASKSSTTLAMSHLSSFHARLPWRSRRNRCLPAWPLGDFEPNYTPRKKKT